MTDPATVPGKTGGKSSRPRKLTPDQWAEVRRFVCAGRAFSEVAAAFGVPVGTVQNRSQVDQWPTPAREKRRKDALARKLQMQQSCDNQDPQAGLETKPVETQITCNKAPSFASLIQSQLTELQTVASDAPDRFGEAAGRFAQVMLAAGFSQAEPPRTVRELAVWEDLRRKFLRLDAKDQTAGLFAPVAPMRRAVGPVVDVPDETTTGDAVDGFEV